MLLITLVLGWLAPCCGLCRVVAGAWFFATLLAPFWVVPLHLHLQRPTGASAALAFLTGIPTWLASATFALCHQIMTDGS